MPGALVLAATLQASLGLGVGTVRYAGGSSFSTATISPAVQVLSPSAYLGAGASFSSLPRGVWATLGRGDLWAATSEADRVRLALGATAATTSRTDGGWTAVAHAVAEVLWSAPGGATGIGVGAGPSYGDIEGEPSLSALHLRARAWWSAAPLQYTASVEPSRLSGEGAWFTDVTLGATVDRERVVAGAWTVVRLSKTYGSKGTASASLQVFVAPHVALEVTGGGYLADPYQGFPRAGFITAGVRVQATARALHPAPRAPARELPPLVAERRGDSVVVRFRMPGASSVAIAGDWNAWHPMPLGRDAGDVWGGALALKPGTYHFSLLVDGREWVVPGGVAIVPDGFGGLVAVLTVL